jgi:hypothetical protein
MVSIESARVGGQYLSGWPVSDEATFTTTKSGPGVSGMPLSRKSCLPLLPPTFSQMVMVPCQTRAAVRWCDAVGEHEACRRCLQQLHLSVGRTLPGLKTFTQSLNHRSQL